MKSRSEYIFGLRPAIEAINAGKSIERVFLKNDIKGDLASELFILLKKNDIPFQRVPLEKLNRITRKNHQGIISFISPIEYVKIEGLIPLLYEQGKIPALLILDGVTDVRNFGSIARTAECAGLDAIIIPERGAAQINADAVKTSAGALYNIPVCRTRDLVKTVTFLKESGIQVVAVSEKSQQIYFNSDLTLPTALIMGAEDTGISAELIRHADLHLSIPIKGKINSLNVSVATGIMVYELVKQRNAADR